VLEITFYCNSFLSNRKSHILLKVADLTLFIENIVFAIICINFCLQTKFYFLQWFQFTKSISPLFWIDVISLAHLNSWKRNRDRYKTSCDFELWNEVCKFGRQAIKLFDTKTKTRSNRNWRLKAYFWNVLSACFGMLWHVSACNVNQ
jgi:hypothetical protein